VTMKPFIPNVVRRMISKSARDRGKSKESNSGKNIDKKKRLILIGAQSKREFWGGTEEDEGGVTW